jgi:hypothetical protein
LCFFFFMLCFFDILDELPDIELPLSLLDIVSDGDGADGGSCAEARLAIIGNVASDSAPVRRTIENVLCIGVSSFARSQGEAGL